MGKPAPTVVVASDDPVLLDEIVRHLEELPSWRLAGWARTAGELQRLLVEHAPDAALVSAGLARGLDAARSGEQPAAVPAGEGHTRLVVVAGEQDAGILRCSLRLGAGFVLWPQERDELRPAVEAGLPAPAAAPGRSRLVAVWGPKGGSGTTVLAAHLAGAAAGVAPCMLVDLDLRHGDQRVLLGAGDHPRSFLDLITAGAAGDDIPPSAVEGVAWSHPAGFRVVLGPVPSPAPDSGRALPETWSAVAPAMEAIVAMGAGGAGVSAGAGGGAGEARSMVVADLPSGLGRFSVDVAARADATVIVVTPDLLALRRARDASGAVGEGPEVGVILNRRSRGAGELSPGDVEAVLALPVWASVPVQAGLPRAPDLGRLSRPACRALAPLAARLAAGAAGGSGIEGHGGAGHPGTGPGASRAPYTSRAPAGGHEHGGAAMTTVRAGTGSRR
jgi:pilus assembly protein CpaE